VLADRLSNLGTETAFAVSLAAAEWRAKGNRIFPFHLGDINLPTPANVVEALDRAIADGKTGYCAAAGIAPLRQALADDVSARRGLTYGPNNVAVEPGGKPVIGKFLQVVMNPGDGVLFPTPGYPIYESQIDYFGGVGQPYRYVQTPTGFAIDIDHLRSQLTPATTVLIYNNLQNPLGCESSAEEMATIAELAVERGLWVLSDEAYFEMRYSGVSTSIAALPGMHERTVILYTFSKKFAMTGWRLGAAVGPEDVIAQITKINTNDESCTTHFVQAAGVEALLGDQSGPRAILAELEQRRDAAVVHTQSIPGCVVAKPESTFYLFPNVTEAMASMGFAEVADFADAALRATGVSFCTRRHFGRPLPGETEHYIRLAYSGISVGDIGQGLGLLRQWIEAAR
jgi:aspartate/methionine/tyrosine aminotransferase